MEWCEGVTAACLAAELELTVLSSSDSAGPARTGREAAGSLSLGLTHQHY